MISDHYTECVCNHLTHFAVLMDFTNNADDGKVTICFFYKIKLYGPKKVHRSIKVSHLFLLININISFDTDKIIMIFTVFQSG